jgi:hypothetical protein
MRVTRTAVAAMLLLACGAAVAGAVSAGAASDNASVKLVDAHIGTRSITEGTKEHPVVINPKVPTVLSMTLANQGTTPVHVRYLRLSGSILGIDFVRYQASAQADIDPGATKTVSANSDFFDVDGVATGYVNAKMEAVDAQRSTIASQSFVADVQGKFLSSEGIFFLQILAFALISLVDVAYGISRRRLPRNRFIAAVLFAFAAASTVITIVVGAAMARVALFEPQAWVPALFVATAGAFVLGYLSPSRLSRTATEDADEKVIDLVAAGAVARASGEQARRTTGGTPAHESGDHTLDIGSHKSGEFSVRHESGQYDVEQHDSGEYSAAQRHESGSHEPQEQ